MKIGKQLKKIREHLRYSQGQFAEVLGLSAKGYWNYEKDFRDVPSEIIIKLANAYGVNPSWLVSGEGNMFSDENKGLPIDAIRGKYAFGMPDEEIMKLVGKRDFINIPVYGDVSASLGYGITVYDEKQTATYAISKELARDLGIQKLDSKMIFAQGDSMEPTIIGGDSLLVDTSKKEVYDGKIYCVRIDGQLYAKRLQKIPPNKIRVISDNRDKYEPLSIDLKNLDFDFEIIGEIKWWGRVAK